MRCQEAKVVYHEGCHFCFDDSFKYTVQPIFKLAIQEGSNLSQQLLASENYLIFLILIPISLI